MPCSIFLGDGNISASHCPLCDFLYRPDPISYHPAKPQCRSEYFSNLPFCSENIFIPTLGRPNVRFHALSRPVDFVLVEEFLCNGATRPRSGTATHAAVYVIALGFSNEPFLRTKGHQNIVPCARCFDYSRLTIPLM